MNNKKIRQKLFDMQGGLCCYCGGSCILELPEYCDSSKPPINLSTIEHLVSKTDNNAADRNSIKNLRMACRHCNQILGDVRRSVKVKLFGKIVRF